MKNLIVIPKSNVMQIFLLFADNMFFGGGAKVFEKEKTALGGRPPVEEGQLLGNFSQK